MTYEVIFVVAVDGVHVHEVLAAGAGAWCALVGVVRAAEVVAKLCKLPTQREHLR